MEDAGGTLSLLNSFFNRWYRSVDRPLFVAFVMMSLMSLMLVSSSGPVIAGRVMLPQDYFLFRHLSHLFIALCVIVVYSMMSEELIIGASAAFLSVCVGLLIYIAFWGTGVKGSKRWFFLLGLSIQPSEFSKTFFSIVNAWILCHVGGKLKYCASTALYALLASLILLQPDLSMFVLLSTIWGGQLFVYGISYVSIFVILSLLAAGILLCLKLLPYAKERVMIFLDPNNHNHFQIWNSIKSFKTGKIVGAGPGEGVVKLMLPDCHTDFVFSLAAEEFGAIFCVLILSTLGYISLRAWTFAYKEIDLFKLVAVAGLFFQFSSQFMVNVGVALDLLPTTGVALPFLSYGGSSLVSTSMMLGMLMALTRIRTLERRIPLMAT
ncbi:MAG: FtsW/RodA/SpoVE family cell cycle protein [Anaplasma sp.]